MNNFRCIGGIADGGSFSTEDDVTKVVVTAGDATTTYRISEVDGERVWIAVEGTEFPVEAEAAEPDPSRVEPQTKFRI